MDISLNISKLLLWDLENLKQPDQPVDWNKVVYDAAPEHLEYGGNVMLALDADPHKDNHIFDWNRQYAIDNINNGHSSLNYSAERAMGNVQKMTRTLQYMAPEESYLISKLPHNELSELFFSYVSLDPLKSFKPIPVPTVDSLRRIRMNPTPKASRMGPNLSSRTPSLPQGQGALLRTENTDSHSISKLQRFETPTIATPTPLEPNSEYVKKRSPKSRRKATRQSKPKYPYVSPDKTNHVVIGPFGTLLSSDDYFRISWYYHLGTVTSKLLLAIFGSETLATHNLEEVNPKIKNKSKSLNKLDSDKVNDIIHLITSKMGARKADIQKCIRDKCSKEKQRQKYMTNKDE